MPEETETPHPDYVKGFNEGYLLAQHLPELAAKLPKEIAGERGEGFVAGKAQYLLEQSKEKHPAWLKSDRLSSLDKGDAPVKYKDANGPDRS